VTALLGLPSPADAYIGPGAGFALASSFMVVFLTTLLAFAALLAWPFRTLWRMVRRRKKSKPLVKRFIVVGFDGQDPLITDRLLAEGRLPSFRKLAESGCYHRLGTTYPSITPVAWSSFSTGTHPGKHNIFDFLDRDRRSYLPILSSVRIGNVDRFLRLGKLRIPLKKPELTLLRKSKPWWSVLGEHNVWSTVLRVPITFPPDKFYGAQLGAMSIPDLLGTQGTFILFTTRASDEKFKEGGVRVVLSSNGAGPDHFDTVLEGPGNPFREGEPPLQIPLSIALDRPGRYANIRMDGEVRTLNVKELSEWITLSFKAAPGVKVSGLCRMMVTEMDEHFSLYVTPITIDPERPAMPISHPSFFSTYLAKKVGPYSTLGLAEDTWALNEKVTDDATFWRQTMDIDDERQRMFFSALDRTRQGAVVCVFDAIDRIQHMFWRYTEDGHPAAAGITDPEQGGAVEAMYERNDEILGRVLEKVTDGDVLVAMSDHGFTSFRRGVNLNAWLLAKGYLHLREGAGGSSEWLRDVDWSRTRAYCVGLTGMFLNLEGREAEGTVKPGAEAEALKKEIMAGLKGLEDEEAGEIGIVEAFDTNVIYTGPYKGNAPDLLIGYNHGYRASWDCASGVVSGPVFEDNVKAWSGDHCVDPRLVPGVLFCNRAIESADPSIVDLAPTALRLFGVEVPPYMEGKPLLSRASVGSSGRKGTS
jgi:predicted AlkP superfamily phosphohydrolase/phosphomutase